MVLSISSPKATKWTKIGLHQDMALPLIKVLNMNPAEMIEPFVITISFVIKIHFSFKIKL